MNLLPDPPTDSELQRWIDDGQRHEPAHSNVVTFVDPDERYVLRVEVDDPIHGYLIRLWTLGEEDRDERIGQAVVEDRDRATQVAAELAAAADDLAALEDAPKLGPPTIDRETVDHGTVQPPEEWDDQEDEWQENLEEAYEKAEDDGPVRAKGSLTTKTINNNDYYYLQWRSGEKVKSQYVAPVNPSNADR